MPIFDYQWLQLNPNVARIRLAPSAISWGADGAHERNDHQWLSTINADGTPRLQNSVTGHYIDLKPADVIEVVPDPTAPHSELKHVRVTLACPLVLRGAEAFWQS